MNHLDASSTTYSGDYRIIPQASGRKYALEKWVSDMAAISGSHNPFGHYLWVTDADTVGELETVIEHLSGEIHYYNKDPRP